MADTSTTKVEDVSRRDITPEDRAQLDREIAAHAEQTRLVNERGWREREAARAAKAATCCTCAKQTRRKR